MNEIPKDDFIYSAITQLKGYRKLISDETRNRTILLERFRRLGQSGVSKNNQALFERILRNPLEGI